MVREVFFLNITDKASITKIPLGIPTVLCFVSVTVLRVVKYSRILQSGVVIELYVIGVLCAVRRRTSAFEHNSESYGAVTDTLPGDVAGNIT